MQVRRDGTVNSLPVSPTITDTGLSERPLRPATADGDASHIWIARVKIDHSARTIVQKQRQAEPLK
jgi:hypothetical protein